MGKITRNSQLAIVQSNNEDSEYIVNRTNIYNNPIDGEKSSSVHLKGKNCIIHKDVKFRLESPDLVQQIWDLNVMVNILTKFEYPDLLQMQKTNHEIYRICQMDELWRIKLSEDFKFNIPTDNPLGQVYSEVYLTEQSILGANLAAKNGQLHILKWLNDLNPDSPIRPNTVGANSAAENGHLHVLEWLNSLVPTCEFDSPIHWSIRPDFWGADNAAMYGHLHVLEWLNSLEPPVHPSIIGANWAAESGHLHVLRWLNNLESDVQIHPNVEGANNAVENCQLEVLEWLNALEPPVLPNIRGANIAAWLGYLDVLEWLNNLDPPVSPSIDGVNWAAASGHLHVLEWLRNLNPLIQEY